jgi:hypothetical protein
MTTFGKVLAVVNVVLAIAFVCLIASDYSRRRAWEFAILGEDFQIGGLPVDDQQKDAEGQLLKDLVTKQMQQQLGAQTTTQVEFLTARYQKCKSAMDSAAAPDAKMVEVQKFVLPLARNALEHYEIASAKAAAFAENADFYKKLMADDGPFESAYNAGKQATGSFDARRYAIARFLLGTSAEQRDYEDTLAVVGLASYAQAVEGQAVHLEAMVPALQREMVTDRNAFVDDHRALIERIVALNRQVQDLQLTLAKEEDLLTQSKTVRDARKQDAADLQKRIAAATAVAKHALTVQSDLEKQLFATDGEAARTKEQNEKLDLEIKRKELGH